MLHKMKTWRNLKYRAARTIQTRWKLYNSTRDPISLCRIEKQFVVIRHNCVHLYDAHHLHSYIYTTGDYKDPIARIEYDNCELMRLNNKVGALRRHCFVDLIDQKARLLQKRKIQMEMSTLGDVLEDELLEELNYIKTFAHDDDWHPVLEYKLPTITYAFYNLNTLDRCRCRMFIEVQLKLAQQDDMAWQLGEYIALLGILLNKSYVD